MKYTFFIFLFAISINKSNAIKTNQFLLFLFKTDTEVKSVRFDSILPARKHEKKNTLKCFSNDIFERDQEVRKQIFECAGHKLNSKTPLTLKRNLIDSCKRFFEFALQSNDSINRQLFDGYFQKYGWPKRRWSHSGGGYLVIFDHCGKEYLSRYFSAMTDAKRKGKLPSKYYHVYFDKLQLMNCKPQRYGSYRCKDKTDSGMHPCLPTEFSKKCAE
jgi:hypothetical protein